MSVTSAQIQSASRPPFDTVSALWLPDEDHFFGTAAQHLFNWHKKYPVIEIPGGLTIGANWGREDIAVGDREADAWNAFMLDRAGVVISPATVLATLAAGLPTPNAIRIGFRKDGVDITVIINDGIRGRTREAANFFQRYAKICLSQHNQAQKISGRIFDQLLQHQAR